MSLEPIILAELQRGGPPLWVSGRTYRAGQCVLSPMDWQVYMRAISGAGTIDPKNDGDKWVRWGATIEAALALVSAAVTNVNAAVGGVSEKADAIQATVTLNQCSQRRQVRPGAGVASPPDGYGIVVPVSAVNMSKSFLLVSPYQSASSSTTLICGGQLISSTQIKLISTVGNGQFLQAAWQLVEFF